MFDLVGLVDRLVGLLWFGWLVKWFGLVVWLVLVCLVWLFGLVCLVFLVGLV